MEAQATHVPPHVPKDLVFDVDLYNDPDYNIDMHAKMTRILGQYPDVFWSPRSGGYWVVGRYALMNEILNDAEHFSSRQGLIPAVEPALPMLPLSLDPPAHTPFRLALMRYLGPRSIGQMQDKVRELAASLIDSVANKDTFEFVDSVGATFPVTVFMQLMGLPLERLHEFRGLVLEFFSVISEERRRELYGHIQGELSALIEDRRKTPRDDLMSGLLSERIDGQPISHENLLSMAMLLFMAGMDTVANGLAFMFCYLAQRPDQQAELLADPSKIPAFVEESLRMYPVVNTPRQVVKDVNFHGAQMKKGDMIFVMLALAGRDDRIIPDAPDTFKIARPDHPHMAFGGGPHVCAGQFLARVEMLAFVEEWLKRVSKFELAPGYSPVFRSWQVMALTDLRLKITERTARA